jgi:adhesin/invasin
VTFSLTITVQDAYGNVVTGYTGTIRFSSTDKTATLPANYTLLAADRGVHTFSGLILRKRGNQTITITDTLNSSITSSVIVNVV